MPTLREQRPGEGRLLRHKEDGQGGLCCTEDGAGSYRATDRWRQRAVLSGGMRATGQEQRLL